MTTLGGHERAGHEAAPTPTVAADTAPAPRAKPTPRAPVPDVALGVLLREARSHNGWLPVDVPERHLEAIHELAKWGSTSANGNHARIVFVRSQARGRA